MSLSPWLRRRWEALSALAGSMPLAECALPATIRPVTNGAQGSSLARRAGRRDAQRRLRALGESVGRRLDVQALYIAHGPLVVRLVRVAPRSLDGDNLEAALKRVRDGLAAAVGLDDRDAAVEYVADQRRGAARERALEVEVYRQLQAEPSKPRNRKREHLERRSTPRLAPIGGRLVAVTPNVRRPRR